MYYTVWGGVGFSQPFKTEMQIWRKNNGRGTPMAKPYQVFMRKLCQEKVARRKPRVTCKVRKAATK